jgi:hypothetical protein
VIVPAANLYGVPLQPQFASAWLLHCYLFFEVAVAEANLAWFFLRGVDRAGLDGRAAVFPLELSKFAVESRSLITSWMAFRIRCLPRVLGIGGSLITLPGAFVALVVAISEPFSR